MSLLEGLPLPCPRGELCPGPLYAYSRRCANFVREHGYGAHYLGGSAEDMEAALAEAGRAGYAMTMDGADDMCKSRAMAAMESRPTSQNIVFSRAGFIPASIQKLA